MNAKHTAGEWGVAKVDGGAGDDEIATIVDGCLVCIASVFGQGEYSEARPNGEPEPAYTVSKAEAEANARLIAAAPELLNALESIMKQAASDAEKYANNGNEPIWAYISDAADAIAKARGEA